jgi:hypothetical protein
MNIELFLKYPDNTPDIVINFAVKDKTSTMLAETSITLQNHINSVKLNFELSTFDKQDIWLHVNTKDSKILNFPLEIIDIVLDNFYSRPGLIYSGSNHYDSWFLSFAEQKKMWLDPHVCDNNLLFFTGTLKYKFVWPFFKNIIKF